MKEGDWVSVTSPRGTVYCEVRIEDTLEPGVAWMPFHYGGGANVLTDAHNLDPICSIPGYKQVGVRIAKVSEEVALKQTERVQSNERSYFENEVQNILWYQEPSEAIALKERSGCYQPEENRLR